MEKKHNYRSKTNRRNRILELLDQGNPLRVTELSELLDTSVVTIRKDLDEMEQEGVLKRVHGGAVQHTLSRRDQLYSERENLKRHEKNAIAVACANLVHDGESLFITSGSTCSCVFHHIKHKNNLIIITNSLKLFNEISNHDHITLFFLGGRFDNDMQITVGDDVTSQMSKYMVNKLIVGMDGIDLVAGATSFNHTEDQIMHQLLAQAQEKILVVDDSKIGKVAFAHIADLNQFDTLITNYNPDNVQILKEIERMGIRVIVV